MAGESRQRREPQSSENIRTNVPRKFGVENLSKFGRVVIALWPDKPALNLAQRAGLSERGAQYIIDGRRKPNARVVHVVNGEMLEE
jgi:hypothetical protein